MAVVYGQQAPLLGRDAERFITVRPGDEELLSGLTVEGKPLEKHSIRAIVEGLNGELWIGTPDGLYKLVLNVEGKAEIKGNYEQVAGTAARYVRALHASTDGQLYIGYTEGLGILAQNKDSIQHFYTTRDGMCSNLSLA